jgi:hypothetical protein
MIELEPSQFENTDMLHWATERQILFGDEIQPKKLYKIEGEDGTHHAAWVEHSWLNFNTGDVYHAHHIMCECAAVCGIQDAIGARPKCLALNRAFLERSFEISAEVKKQESKELISEELADQLGSDTNDRIFKEVVYLLDDDIQHPEEWHANVHSGRHLMPLLSKILRYSEKSIKQSISPAIELGTISLRGSVVRLNVLPNLPS